jgi:uncharacterized membrane protein YkoI
MKVDQICMSLATVALVFGLNTSAYAAQSKPSAQPKVEAGDENDEVIPMAKVPKVVRDTLSQYAKESEVQSASKGDVDGTAVYEFDIVQGAKKFEVAITPKGAFFGSEEVVQLADVPEPTRSTFNKQAQGGKIVSVEKAVDKNKKTSFEAIIEKSGKQTEVVVDLTGKVVSTEKVKAEK